MTPSSFPVSLFGTYSKAIEGAIAINFGRSGSAGNNCLRTCAHYGTTCYAEAVERRKPSVSHNLQVKQDNLETYLERLTSRESRKIYMWAPWIRVSVFGALPPLNAVSRTARARLAHLGDILHLHREKLHVPVEDVEKALRYRDLGWDVRASLGTTDDPLWRDRWRHAQDLGMPVAVTASVRRIPGWTSRAKIQARQLQRELRGEGTVKVCPAVIGSAKCGDCRLCTTRGADLVIYPEHQ